MYRCTRNGQHHRRPLQPAQRELCDRRAMPRRNFRKLLRPRLIRLQQFPPCNGIPGQEYKHNKSESAQFYISIIRVSVWF